MTLNNEKVFITGLSALTASGATAEDTWESIIQGRSGIAPIAQWDDVSDWPYPLGGELKGFQPAKMLPDKKLIKVISRHDVMGIHAALTAVEHSQLIPYRDSLSCAQNFNDRTGVYVGSPGNKYFQQYDFLPLLAKTKGNMQEFAKNLFEEVHPMWLLRILPNNVLAYTGITYGFKGPNQNVTNHAVGGSQALLEAWHAIRSGQIDRAVVVAYDMGVEPQALFYYAKLGLISSRHLKPFDKEHDGTILAEGAAAVVLESESSLKARGAAPYGELVGGATTNECLGLFSIESEGQHLSQLINRTLELTQLNPQDIGMIVAHGNGNPKSDTSEIAAIQNSFAQESPPITAFKWSMGHTLCASGLVDAVMTSYALQKQCVPGIANLQRPYSEKLLNLSNSHKPFAQNKHALLINRGFAGMNVCLVMKACE